MDDLARETITDLLRSSWLIEAARRDLYRLWAKEAAGWDERADGAEQRAEILEKALAARGRKADAVHLEKHAAWLRGVVGEDPDEVPLGGLFAARLGDWVEGHATRFLDGGADRLAELGTRERESLVFPDSLPEPPPFEPVETIETEPPGRVRFRFAILGDLHFGSPGGERTARVAMTDIAASGAELVIQLGDVTNRGTKDEFDLAKKTLAEFDIPITTMMGNHDIYSLEEERLSGREYYGSAFDREPDGVLLEHKGMRFAVLDSATSAASPFPPFNFVSGSFLEGSGGAVVHGSLTVPQHEILADVAAPGSGPAFVFLHHPPQPFTGFPPILFGLRDADSGRLHATVDSGNVWGVFAGHTHRNARTRDFGRVPAQEVAIPRDFPFGYALVDVADEGYAYRFVQLSDEALLRKAYKHASAIHRRFGLGKPEERSFVWTATA
ncbi:MAG TPA: metallophosphoesterase [Actinomycetota bacterium]|nr:metallophosphoesterase [Actinomycetota bacterium]